MFAFGRRHDMDSEAQRHYRFETFKKIWKHGFETHVGKANIAW